jgi:hypothetical protein
MMAIKILGRYSDQAGAVCAAIAPTPKAKGWQTTRIRI